MRSASARAGGFARALALFFRARALTSLRCLGDLRLVGKIIQPAAPPADIHHEMIVIAHQNVGVHLPGIPLTDSSEGREEGLPILVAQENRFPTIAAEKQVIERPSKFDPRHSRHRTRIS